MTRHTAMRHDSTTNRALHWAGWGLIAAGIAATATTGKKRYAAIGAAAGFGLGALGHAFETQVANGHSKAPYRIWEELGIKR